MATTAPKAATAAKKLVANFPESPDRAKAEALADAVMRPSINAAAVVGEYTKVTFGEQQLGDLAAKLSSDTKALWAGDMRRTEAMLYGQAHALQAIFTNLARRAAANLGEHPDAFERYMRMALKAQGQCRMTLETLATIKNPPVVFARQANINNGGQQQVNNTAASSRIGPQNAHAGACAANRGIVQTELLEASDGQRLDTRAASPASGADPHLATLGAIDRTAHR